jgi:hypothetical protein
MLFISSPIGYYNLGNSSAFDSFFMVFCNADTGHQPWLTRGIRAWVLIILLLGMQLSFLGHLHSHGFSKVAVTEQEGVTGHGHSHEIDLPGERQSVSEAERAHHNTADHSHEKAYAFPQSASTAVSSTSIWRALAHPLIRGRIAARIDRPPMV